jgi:hypothetical protein
MTEVELRAGPTTGVAPDGGGRKDDGGKLAMHLIAPSLVEGVSAVLAFGARKYGARNWERGMSWSRPFGAVLRHLWAWWRGEPADPETGMSHLWHAACCIMFLIEYERRTKAGTLPASLDDRPTETFV